MHKCLNLGSGNDYRDGWVNVDLHSSMADVRHDLSKAPWPFPDAHFDYAYADQVLEHIPLSVDGRNGYYSFLRELCRVLKPSGVAYIGVPHGKDAGATWENLGHTRPFYPRSLWALDPEHPGFDASAAEEAGLTLRVLDTVELRRLILTPAFDSEYHVPKYLGFHPNIGRRRGLVWLISPRGVSA
jgi:predicted SAM-dependent methyltransferase